MGGCLVVRKSRLVLLILLSVVVVFKILCYVIPGWGRINEEGYATFGLYTGTGIYNGTLIYEKG